MAKRSAAGSIRQRKDGRWEARYTAGQQQRSVYGQTQREVRQKLTSILSDIDNGTYQVPSKITLDKWLDTWTADYLADETTQTSLAGVFAVGDIRTKPLRQIVTAAADGATASKYVEDYVRSYGR